MIRGRWKKPGLGALQALALWLGLAAVILQGFLPLGLGALAKDGQSIVICTARGMETVRIGADGKALATQSIPNSSLCSVCSDCTAARGGFIVPPPIPSLHPIVSAEAVPATKDSVTPASPTHLPYASRAPPAVA